MSTLARSACRKAAWVGAALLALGCLTGTAQAEDLKGRWYLGGNISFLSTTDDIRSNSAIIIGAPGDDGIPFTGDPNEEQGCIPGQNETTPFCDPRPDDLLSRESTIEETLKLEATAGFGLTSWFSLQLDVGYFKGDVGPVDAFVRQPLLASNLVSNNINQVLREENVIPVGAGEITEIPVSLTGIIRFRKDSPLNPYVGVGGGMIFAEMDVSEDVADLNARFGRMRIKGAGNEYNQSIVPESQGSLASEGRIPFQWPVTVNVDDALEWHVTGGAEYFFNDRMSMIFDAKYMWADQSVNINLGGQDQIDVVMFSENLFREDGTLKFFTDSGGAPNTACADTYGVDSDGDPIKGVGCPDPPQNNGNRVACPANQPAPGGTGDLDNSGNSPLDPDICYDNAVFLQDAAQFDDTNGVAVIQGGKIDLSGLSIAVGFRFHW